MILGEYQKQSRAFVIYPKAGGNVVYPTLGLVEELGELIDTLENGDPKDDILQETGDVMWYIAQLASECGIDLGELEKQMIVPPPHPNRTVIIALARIALQVACKVCGKLKKAIRDQGYETTSDVDQHRVPDSLRSIIREAVIVITIHVAAITSSLGVNIYSVLEMNCQKLQDRQDRGVIQGSGNHR